VIARRAVVVAVGGALALSSCGGEISSVERGEELFASTALSPTDLNVFSCATCHDPEPDAPATGGGRPGYGLFGAANRSGFWGGDRATLRDAVDACLVFFMKAEPIDPAETEARALYDYLRSISPADASGELLSFTVVENVADVERGDPARGEQVYAASCEICHGAAFGGSGSILRQEVLLPEVTSTYPEEFPGVDRSLVVIEKVRHGRFFDIGGDMPLFSREAMSDEDLGALLSFLEL
jgi:thiosulfate dehydrogenase